MHHDEESKPDCHSDDELLDAASARAQHEDEFLHTVQHDERMKPRRAELHFNKHPERLVELVRHDGTVECEVSERGFSHPAGSFHVQVQAGEQRVCSKRLEVFTVMRV